MVTCANGHGRQVPGGICTVCGLALPAAGMQVWGAPSTSPQSFGSSAGPTPPPPVVPTAPLAPPSTVPPPPPVIPGYPAPYLESGSSSGNPSRRRRPWIIVAAIVVAFLVAGGATYFIVTKPVPDVVGMAPEQARSELGSAGFTDVSVTEEFSNSIPRGQVSLQEPAPGSRARGGQAVSLIVSRGTPKEVPVLTGESRGSASSQVSGLDLRVTTVSEPSETVPEGDVISQDPPPGTVLEEGDGVSLVVSSGPPYTTVTVELDLFSVVLESDWSDCSDAMVLLKVYFTNSAIVGDDGRTLSTLSGLWDEVPGNGSYFPCEAVGTFPRTSTQEDIYTFFMDPSDRSNGGITFSRSELEGRGWTMSLG